jgi:Mechanosensitive ion channel
LEGIVLDVGWYRTTIRSFEREIYNIPNSVFSRNVVLNITRKQKEWRFYEFFGGCFGASLQGCSSMSGPSMPCRQDWSLRDGRAPGAHCAALAFQWNALSLLCMVVALDVTAFSDAATCFPVLSYDYRERQPFVAHPGLGISSGLPEDMIRLFLGGVAFPSSASEKTRVGSIHGSLSGLQA